MPLPFQSKTRLQIRQAVGYLLNSIIVGEVGATGASTTVLPDPTELAIGGSNDYKGRQVIITASTGTANVGSVRFVSSFASSDDKLTLAPAMTAAMEAGDDYELWQYYSIKQVNESINHAIRSATDDILINKQTSTTYKLEDVYEYDCLTDFVALHTVEYEFDVGIDHLLEDCESAWTAGSANVTVTADTAFKKLGDACHKAVEDGGSSTTDILSYATIDSADISDCDKVEFWMYSSIALTAGQLQIHLDDTAAIASAVESINIPAMTAATWYRHSLTLANPHLDTAIISLGIYQVADVGAFTFYVDDVHAIKSNSRVWHQLNPDMWFINNTSTPLLGITQAGYGGITNSTPLRLTGFAKASELSADATACEIDPDYVISFAAAWLLSTNFKPTGENVDAGRRLVRDWLDIAETRKRSSRTDLGMNVRWI